MEAVQAYKAWVRQNRQWLSSFESLANTLTWLLPERLASSELAPEALSSVIGLVTALNEYIVETAPKEPQQQQPPGTASVEGGTDGDSAVPWSLVVAVVKEVEVLGEMSAEHYLGADRKWGPIALIEAIKAALRLLIFKQSGWKMLLGGGQTRNDKEAAAQAAGRQAGGAPAARPNPGHAGGTGFGRPRPGPLPVHAVADPMTIAIEQRDGRWGPGRHGGAAALGAHPRQVAAAGQDPWHGGPSSGPHGWRGRDVGGVAPFSASCPPAAGPQWSPGTAASLPGPGSSHWGRSVHPSAGHGLQRSPALEAMERYKQRVTAGAAASPSWLTGPHVAAAAAADRGPLPAQQPLWTSSGGPLPGGAAASGRAAAGPGGGALPRVEVAPPPGGAAPSPWAGRDCAFSAGLRDSGAATAGGAHTSAFELQEAQQLSRAGPAGRPHWGAGIGATVQQLRRVQAAGGRQAKARAASSGESRPEWRSSNRGLPGGAGPSGNGGLAGPAEHALRPPQAQAGAHMLPSGSTTQAHFPAGLSPWQDLDRLPSPLPGPHPFRPSAPMPPWGGERGRMPPPHGWAPEAAPPPFFPYQPSGAWPAGSPGPQLGAEQGGSGGREHRAAGGVGGSELARWCRAAGEVAHILRPMVYVLAIRRYGLRSWRPWLISLGMDLGSLALLESVAAAAKPAGKGGAAGDGGGGLPPHERSELSRRKLLLALYLMRSPFFNSATRRPLDVLEGRLKAVPLLGMLTEKALELVLGVQAYYFYTAAS